MPNFTRFNTEGGGGSGGTGGDDDQNKKKRVEPEDSIAEKESTSESDPMTDAGSTGPVGVRPSPGSNTGSMSGPGTGNTPSDGGGGGGDGGGGSPPSSTPDGPTTGSPPGVRPAPGSTTGDDGGGDGTGSSGPPRPPGVPTRPPRPADDGGGGGSDTGVATPGFTPPDRGDGGGSDTGAGGGTSGGGGGGGGSNTNSSDVESVQNGLEDFTSPQESGPGVSERETLAWALEGDINSFQQRLRTQYNLTGEDYNIHRQIGPKGQVSLSASLTAQGREQRQTSLQLDYLANNAEQLTTQETSAGENGGRAGRSKIRASPGSTVGTIDHGSVESVSIGGVVDNGYKVEVTTDTGYTRTEYVPFGEAAAGKLADYIATKRKKQQEEQATDRRNALHGLGVEGTPENGYTLPKTGETKQEGDARQQARSQITSRLSKQTGLDLSQSDITFTRTDSGLSGQLSKEARNQLGVEETESISASDIVTGRTQTTDVQTGAPPLTSPNADTKRRGKTSITDRLTRGGLLSEDTESFLSSVSKGYTDFFGGIGDYAAASRRRQIDRMNLNEANHAVGVEQNIDPARSKIVVEGVAGALNPAAFAKNVETGVEVATNVPGEVAAGNADEVATAGIDVGQAIVQNAVSHPFRTAGGLVGGYAVGVGVSRLLETTGAASAIKGAGSKAVTGVARRAPDGGIQRLRDAASADSLKSFMNDERGMANLRQTGRSSSEDSTSTSVDYGSLMDENPVRSTAPEPNDAARRSAETPDRSAFDRRRDTRIQRESEADTRPRGRMGDERPGKGAFTRESSQAVRDYLDSETDAATGQPATSIGDASGLGGLAGGLAGTPTEVADLQRQAETPQGRLDETILTGQEDTSLTTEFPGSLPSRGFAEGFRETTGVTTSEGTTRGLADTIAARPTQEHDLVGSSRISADSSLTGALTDDSATTDVVDTGGGTTTPVIDSVVDESTGVRTDSPVRQTTDQLPAQDSLLTPALSSDTQTDTATIFDPTPSGTRNRRLNIDLGGEDESDDELFSPMSGATDRFVERFADPLGGDRSGTDDSRFNPTIF